MRFMRSVKKDMLYYKKTKTAWTLKNWFLKKYSEPGFF